ncbi:dnaJ homolog subfamily C member 4 isoform X2 [Xiphophorus hellerii]|uniref:dnaJ homolog subfamily C member 4 isoform X2 n=1 Tax=Xiphophorus hellerii TaxID=8084 RepID=UPI0013B3857C|nr:dnaJ homolog subfamily C member 4 isoform X2 [Xiphophorus hellerii]
MCCSCPPQQLQWKHSERSKLNIFRHAAGSSAATMSELYLVLQEWTADAISQLCTKLHPDSNPSNPKLHSQFVELNEAYRVLSKELSRKEYDLKLQHPYQGGQAFRSTSGHTMYRSTTTNDNVRYWEQFRHAQSPEATAEERKQKKKRNFRLVIYCVITMVFSVGAHAVFFRKLEEVHNSFMDEKDRAITEIYNEAKERARVNGFKKQTEILRQKHADFQEKVKMNKGGPEK